MRLKLTIEYDGTGFRGWARQPGRADGRGRAAARARRSSTAASSGLAVAGRTDTGVHALANVVSVDVEGGPPPERGAEALNAAPAARPRGRSRRSTCRTTFHARFDARCALVSLPHLAAPRALGARGAARALASAAARSRRRSRRTRGAARRRARLPRLHADARRSTERFVRTVYAGAVGRARRGRRRVRDHGRLVPAPHGADARRHDARRPATSPRSSTAARAARPARRHRRTACTTGHARRVVPAGRVLGTVPGTWLSGHDGLIGGRPGRE